MGLGPVLMPSLTEGNMQRHLVNVVCSLFIANSKDVILKWYVRPFATFRREINK